MAKNSIDKATLLAEKLRLANSRMSSIGSSRRNSHATNSAPTIAPTAKLTSVEREVQPSAGAWMMAYTTEPTAAIDRRAPTGSSLVASGFRESGTRCSVPSSATARTGTLIQNTDDHEKLRM